MEILARLVLREVKVILVQPDLKVLREALELLVQSVQLEALETQDRSVQLEELVQLDLLVPLAQLALLGPKEILA